MTFQQFLEVAFHTSWCGPDPELLRAPFVHLSNNPASALLTAVEY